MNRPTLSRRPLAAIGLLSGIALRAVERRLRH